MTANSPTSLATHHKNFIAAAALVAMTIVAYLPAFRAGFVWDDPDYVVNNATLRSFEGLRQIWLEPSATPQYYPMVFTAFWAEFQLWGLNPAGYHTVNVLLHAGSAILLWLLLRRLGVAAGWLAAAIFAVHPVHVESVAWITERKNVLSGVFYLGAMLAYFRGLDSSPDSTPQPKAASGQEGLSAIPSRWYFVALGLFLCAMLSKTVACSLPAAILLILSWKHGRIGLRRDLIRLLPFFAIGSLALLTARHEREHVGAVGAEWDYDFIERCLIAGRAVWFYLYKLIWPTDLAFIYPKWTIDRSQLWQFAFPFAAVALVAVLFVLRKRIGRGPLVASLFFGGTLLPALGFFNIYPMRYSFVADHFQYLASIGPIVLGASLIAKCVKPRAAWAIALLPLIALALLQARHYRDAETLWRDTLARNPRSWMVHTNLANALADQRRFDEAFDHYQRAAQLADGLPETHWNLGAAYERRGEFEKAFQELDRANAIDPEFLGPYYVRGNIHFKRGELASARAQAESALRISPQFADAHYLLGLISERENKPAEAIEHYRATVQNSLGNADAHYNLANLLSSQGDMQGALVHYSQAIQIRPGWADAHVNLGATLLKLGRTDEAILAFQTALRINPMHPYARRNLQHALAQQLRESNPAN